ncbi:MAG TPA: biotin carboxylase N-terminal domain-containing protein [Acidimicrobiales bacterium]|nr:biotin carboxylase N-terminal domain-containing protein [Acidimicrobiales bacterium]
MFDTVLVANRGEIAVRVIRTLRRLAIRSVAVFSDADAGARHVVEADVARRIGPAPAAESYLSVERIVEAALASGAQALHPGYGFLAESTGLAVACAEAGIVFVGPPVEAIEAMGDKIRAKQTVAAQGVRVVPGVAETGLTDDELVERAVDVGLPLLVKPSAGGGGKGMRLVTDLGDLPTEIAAARREARGAFGDDTLLLERFVERPRHIEVQILADGHGNVVHLGERECSLQRRHQKVIEEAPSPALSEGDRQAIAAQAVAAARACGYVNAGTVEFLVSGDRPDEAFFLEMNTRLQVEHPVTEMVWGVDLVELQLRVAAGGPLPFTQDQLAPTGHAMEARVYAEDPARGFLPTGGSVVSLSEADGLPDVRVDSSLLVGSDVGSTYDPMLAKVVAWGPDRDAARRTLARALAATSVLGVTTNVGFLRTTLAAPEVVRGELDTGLVERIAGRAPPPSTPREAVVAAALARFASDAGAAAPPGGPWEARDGWRLGEPAWTTWSARTGDGEPVAVRLRRTSDVDGFEVADEDGSVVPASLSRTAGRARLDFAGQVTVVHLAVAGPTVWVGRDGEAWRFTEPDPAAVRDPGSGPGGAAAVTSPMPGTVVALAVAVGDEVVAGQALVSVEAMKMEHTLRAAVDGAVSEVLVEAGDRIALDQLLVVVKAAGTQEG